MHARARAARTHARAHAPLHESAHTRGHALTRHATTRYGLVAHHLLLKSLADRATIQTAIQTGSIYMYVLVTAPNSRVRALANTPSAVPNNHNLPCMVVILFSFVMHIVIQRKRRRGGEQADVHAAVHLAADGQQHHLPPRRLRHRAPPHTITDIIISIISNNTIYLPDASGTVRHPTHQIPPARAYDIIITSNNTFYLPDTSGTVRHLPTHPPIPANHIIPIIIAVTITSDTADNPQASSAARPATRTGFRWACRAGRARA